MIDKVWPKTRFRRGTKGDRVPPVGLCWKQGSQVGDLWCSLTNDDRKDGMTTGTENTLYYGMTDGMA